MAKLQADAERQVRALTAQLNILEGMIETLPNSEFRNLHVFTHS
jgi:hypothetical protein